MITRFAHKSLYLTIVVSLLLTTVLGPARATPAAAQIELTARYTYDPSGNLETRTDPNGNTMRYEYDPANRLENILYPDGRAVTYSYDSNGRRTQMVDSLGTTTYRYDPFGRLTDVTDANGNHIGYEYDALSNLTALIYPDGSVVRYGYDVDGRLVRVTDASGATTYSYNAAGQLTDRSLPNGVTTSYTYDDANRLTGIAHVDRAGQTLLAYGYTLDSAGNRTQVIETTREGEQLVTQYAYDSLHRLTGVTYPDDRTVTYAYDAFGNRLTMTTPEGETTYTYNDLSQLVTLTDPDGAVTNFRYDNNGNLIERETPDATLHYAYDYENRLTRYADGEIVVEFIYDGDGNRVAKLVNGDQTNYINNINGWLTQVLQEADGDWRINRSYVLGLERIHQVDRTGNPSFYLFDSPGKSVAGLTDTSGVLVNSYRYDAFGQAATKTESIDNVYTYNGEQNDPETELIFLRHRYYDPSIGRFLTRDALPGSHMSPQSINSYVYVENDPVNFVDPIGMSKFWNGAALLGGLATLAVGAITLPVWGSSMLVAGTVVAGISAGVAIGTSAQNLLFDTDYATAPAEFVVQQFFPESDVGRDIAQIIDLGSVFFTGRVLPSPSTNLGEYLDLISDTLTATGLSESILESGREIFDYLVGGGVSTVGGVSLDRTAEVLVNLNTITGATFDPATGQLILVGQQDLSLPPMNMDDLVVAIRSVYSGEDPGVTMVPLDPSGGDITQRVEYFGQTENTHFGWVMFEADRYLKSMAAGQDTLTGDPLTPDVSGFKSELELSFEQRTDVPWHRNWFVPGEIVLAQAADGQTMVFERAAIQLESRFIQFQPDGSMIDIEGSSPVTDQFTTFVSEHYEEFAAEKPALAELEQLARIVGVVKWLRDNDIPVDLSWVDDYEVAYVETPLTTPGVVAEISSPDGSYTITSFGGVDLSTENTYAEDDDRDAAALRQQALASRPTDTPATWEFELDGETYTSVALNLAPSEVVGGYTAASTDLSLPVSGDMRADFTRRYNSVNLADSTLGPGWSFMPYTLTVQETLIPVSDTEYQIEQRATLMTGAQRVVFTGPYQTAGGETMLLPETPSSVYRDVLLQPDGAFAARRRDGMRILFDPEGRLQFVEDRNGNRLSYLYDEAHPERLIAIGDATGLGLALQYDADGRLTGLLASDGRGVQYSYDAEGRLASVADDVGPVTFYAYDENDLLVEVRDGESRTRLRNSYDGLGRLLAQTDAADYGITTTYPDTGAAIYTDPDGNQVRRVYEESRLISQTDYLGNTVSLGYDSAGNLSSITDPRGYTTNYNYDDWGNLASIESPAGERVQIAYDAEARPMWVIGPDSHMVVYEYDEAGNLVSATDGLLFQGQAADGTITYDPTVARSTEFDFDEQGNPIAITDPVGSTTQMNYDTQGNLTAVQLPSGNMARLTYDGRSRLASITDPLGQTLSFDYDARDNLTRVSTATGSAQYAYDSTGNLSSLTDPQGSVTSFGYDARSNLTSVTEATGAVTTYEYDAARRLKAVVNANGGRTEYEYDPLGRLVAETRLQSPVAEGNEPPPESAESPATEPPIPESAAKPNFYIIGGGMVLGLIVLVVVFRGIARRRKQREEDLWNYEDW